MFRIFLIATILSVVCGTQYAYFGDDVVEFGGSATQAISLPYPYQESKVVKFQPRPIETVYEVRNAVVPVEEGFTPYGIICSLFTSVLSCIKRAIMYVITSLPTLIFSFFGICNLTSLCNDYSVNSLLRIEDLTAFVTPERLKRATELVQSAVRHYRSLTE